MDRRTMMKTLALAGLGCVRKGQSALAAAVGRVPPAEKTTAIENGDCLFAAYDRRFDAALRPLPQHDPTRHGDRDLTVRSVKRCLGIANDWIPEVQVRRWRQVYCHEGTVDLMLSSSRERVDGSAVLYLPNSAWHTPSPLVMLFPGHDQNEKDRDVQQLLARYLVRRGSMVLCPESIGQGTRAGRGHRPAVTPSACGLRAQGAVLMQAMGWVAWALRQQQVDSRRLAVVGHAEGGLSSLFLALLCPELSTLAASGLLETFARLTRQRENPCRCGNLPGMGASMELWHLLGCLAPRPIFLAEPYAAPCHFDGAFQRTASKAGRVYKALDAPDAFMARVSSEPTAWGLSYTEKLGDFLAGPLGLRNL